jgi:hypothetical protein
VNLATQRIRNHICLAQVIMHFYFIVFDQLEPSSLPDIQIRLGKDIVKAFCGLYRCEPHSQEDNVAMFTMPSPLLQTQDYE